MPPICSDLAPSSRDRAGRLGEEASRAARIASVAWRTASARLGQPARLLGSAAVSCAASAEAVAAATSAIASRVEPTRPNLALGALGDLVDRGGDLADGAPGLLGACSHLLRGRRHAVAVCDTWPMTPASAAREAL